MFLTTQLTVPRLYYYCSLMEVYVKRIPWTFGSDDEEQKSPPQALTLAHLSFQTHHQQVFECEPGRLSLAMRPDSPAHLSFNAHEQQVFECDPQLSPTRLSTASTISLFHPSTQNSPWTLSPFQTPPTPSLLYQCLASLHRHDGNVLSVAISKGLVFTATERSRIRVWRQPECIERGRIRTNSGHIRAILAHNNNLFTVHKDQRIRMWTFSISENRFHYKKITTLPTRSRYLPPFLTAKSQLRKDHISCIAYHHAEGLLYTAGSRDKTIKVWRLASNKCEDSFAGHDDGINAMVVDQEEGCLFSCSSDGSVKIWRRTRMHGEISHRLVMILRFQPSPVNALALSNTLMSSFLYSGSADGLVNYWEKEAVSGRYSHGGFLQGHRFAVLCLVAMDRLVLSGSEDTTIRVWKREEESRVHACIAVIEGHRGPVKCMAACMEMERMVMGFLVYSSSLDRTVKVWRIKVFAGVEEGDGKRKKDGMKVDYEMSPVLSPSWVKKKLQGSY
ncbi:hypothetical protein ACLOJK_021167 [Asimina triloba]